jgi:hypothetical protein
MSSPPRITAAMRAAAQVMGALGGAARAKALTPARRTAIARAAAQARWRAADLRRREKGAR